MATARLICVLALVSAASQSAADDAFVRAADRAAASVSTRTGFNWGEGVLMYGLLESYRATGKEEYLDAVRTWADHHCARGIGPTLAERGYCGHWGPGAALLMLHQETGGEAYLAAARQIRAFIRDEATRTSQGALAHYRGNTQIWVDTLCMVCPTLAQYTAATGEADAVGDAAHQLRLAIAHMQNEETGLFYHMWDERTGKCSPEPWGRGNGWVIISLVDVLEVAPADDPLRPLLVDSLKRLIDGLAAHQAESGTWRTVIDRADSYEETSATAMIVYGIAKAMQLGLIQDDYSARLRRAWRAIEENVDAEGVVEGTSAGTGPGDYASYVRRPTGSHTWGTGALLMAGARLKAMGLLP